MEAELREHGNAHFIVSRFFDTDTNLDHVYAITDGVGRVSRDDGDETLSSNYTLEDCSEVMSGYDIDSDRNGGEEGSMFSEECEKEYQKKEKASSMQLHRKRVPPSPHPVVPATPPASHAARKRRSTKPSSISTEKTPNKQPTTDYEEKNQKEEDDGTGAGGYSGLSMSSLNALIPSIPALPVASNPLGAFELTSMYDVTDDSDASERKSDERHTSRPKKQPVGQPSNAVRKHRHHQMQSSNLESSL